MANTMTNILPVAYKAARIVPRLLVGAVASVDTTFDAKFVAKGDTVKVPVVGVGTETDYTPAMTTTAGDNTTPTTVSLTMDQLRLERTKERLHIGIIIAIDASAAHTRGNTVFS